MAGAGGGELLERAFFDRPATQVAPELLGCTLLSETAEGKVSVRLTEVEYYEGADDPASHAYRGKTARNAVMFGEPGHLYVYFTYGMHFCANLVCMPEGTASAVLLRAGDVIDGIDLAEARTGRTGRQLARGPARLTQVLGYGREYDGIDACAGSTLRIRQRGEIPEIESGPRVGIAEAADRPWRLWISDDPTVSPYRKHVPKRRAARIPVRGAGTASGTL